MLRVSVFVTAVTCLPWLALADPLAMTIFQGSCSSDSRIETGKPNGDFHDPAQVRIDSLQCDAVVLSQLPNGRVVVGFTSRATGGTLPAFGGVALHKGNDRTALESAICHIYRNLSSETPGKSPPLDGEGICFLMNVGRAVATAKAIQCVAKLENENVKVVYVLKLDAYKGDTKRFR